MCIYSLRRGNSFSKASGINMQPIWGIDKEAAITTNSINFKINHFSHTCTIEIFEAILSTFAIAPWAYVGFDAIPQAADEFNFSYKKYLT